MTNEKRWITLFFFFCYFWFAWFACSLSFFVFVRLIFDVVKQCQHCQQLPMRLETVKVCFKYSQLSNKRFLVYYLGTWRVLTLVSVQFFRYNRADQSFEHQIFAIIQNTFYRLIKGQQYFTVIQIAGRDQEFWITVT